MLPRMLTALGGLLFSSLTLSAQVAFVDATATSGLGDYDMARRGFGAGAAAADFDDDGFIDLFVPTASGEPDLLYRNLGNGQFEEIAAARGLAGTGLGRAALWLDVSGDGRLDLLVTSDCYNSLNLCESTVPLRLFVQQENGTFADGTDAAGLAMDPPDKTLHRSGIAAGDLDGDGDLDVVTGYWEGTLHVYLNQGNGSFVDATASVGVDDAVRGYHQPVILDLDDDGHMDVFVAVDFSENRLWHGQGTVGGLPTFAEVAETTGCDNAMNDMGVAVGDYDGDGDPDLYVTNIFRLNQHNVLVRNDSTAGAPLCTEVSGQAGVQDGGWGWGTTFFDVDNDTRLDLAETNGWRNDGWEYPPRLYLHQGDDPVTYVDEAASAGLTDASWGSALLALDYDRDGDLDLLQSLQQDGGPGPPGRGGLALYENRSPGNGHYLVVRPRSSGANSRAIGSRVTVEAGGIVQTRWILAGQSYLGQEPAEAFFGLGASERVDRLVVRGPDGRQSVRHGVLVDQVLTVTDDELFLDGFETGVLSAWSSVVP